MIGLQQRHALGPLPLAVDEFAARLEAAAWNCWVRYWTVFVSPAVAGPRPSKLSSDRMRMCSLSRAWSNVASCAIADAGRTLRRRQGKATYGSRVHSIG